MSSHKGKPRVAKTCFCTEFHKEITIPSVMNNLKSAHLSHLGGAGGRDPRTVHGFEGTEIIRHLP